MNCRESRIQERFGHYGCKHGLTEEDPPHVSPNKWVVLLVAMMLGFG